MPRQRNPESPVRIANEEFLRELRAYYASDVISPRLGQLIIELATNLAKKGNFSGYTYKDEMIGDGILKMMTALHRRNFKLENDNPFAYFTTIAYNGFKNRIAEETKVSRMKDQLIKEQLSEEAWMRDES